MKTTAAAAAWFAAIPAAVSAQQNCVTLVTGEKLEATITTEAIMKRAQKLQDIAYSTPDRNRQWFSEGFNLTLEYIKETLEAQAPSYYDIELQPTVHRIPRDPTPLVVNGVTYDTAAMTNNARELYEGTWDDVPIVNVANLGCNPEDYPDATGKMTLIMRGNCTFELKSQLSFRAGAVAALVYNAPASPTFGNGVIGEGFEGKVPVTQLRNPDGAAIRAMVEEAAGGSGPAVTADLTIGYVTLTSHNLIATTKWGNQSNIIMLGAHADSVAEGPGVNDDGSGTVSILEVAVQLARFGVRNAVRFAWWTAEEDGLLGSYYYTEHATASELARIRAYLNFDMVGSSNFVYGIMDGDGSEFGFAGPAGSEDIEALWEGYFAARGLPSDPSEFSGRSDYAGFIDAGIPAGGLTTGADEVKTAEQVLRYGGLEGEQLDPYYHTADDTVANLNATALGVMAKGIAYAVGTYARSFEGFPVWSPPAPARIRDAGAEAPSTRRSAPVAVAKTAEYLKLGPLTLWRI